jgi:hypothetical protein
MPRVLMICLLASLCGLGAASAEDTADPIKASLVSLIADPAAYEGKRVKVAGYLTTAHFEDCAVYLSKDDFDRQITQNAVRLHWSECFRTTKRPTSFFVQTFRCGRRKVSKGFAP